MSIWLSKKTIAPVFASISIALSSSCFASDRCSETGLLLGDPLCAKQRQQAQQAPAPQQAPQAQAAEPEKKYTPPTFQELKAAVKSLHENSLSNPSFENTYYYLRARSAAIEKSDKAAELEHLVYAVHPELYRASTASGVSAEFSSQIGKDNREKLLEWLGETKWTLVVVVDKDCPFSIRSEMVPRHFSKKGVNLAIVDVSRSQSALGAFPQYNHDALKIYGKPWRISGDEAYNFARALSGNDTIQTPTYYLVSPQDGRAYEITSGGKLPMLDELLLNTSHILFQAKVIGPDQYRFARGKFVDAKSTPNETGVDFTNAKVFPEAWDEAANAKYQDNSDPKYAESLEKARGWFGSSEIKRFRVDFTNKTVTRAE